MCAARRSLLAEELAGQWRDAGEQRGVSLIGSLGADYVFRADDPDLLIQAFTELADKVNRQANAWYELFVCPPIRTGTAHPLTVQVEGYDGSLSTTFNATGFGDTGHRCPNADAVQQEQATTFCETRQCGFFEGTFCGVCDVATVLDAPHDVYTLHDEETPVFRMPPGQGPGTVSIATSRWISAEELPPPPPPPPPPAASVRMDRSMRSVEVRILDGGSRGILQVNIDSGGWDAVCDDGFDSDEANAVCRQLGFDSGDSWLTTHGDNSFALDDLDCPSGASGLSECSTNSAPYADDCSDTETVGIHCYDSVPPPPPSEFNDQPATVTAHVGPSRVLVLPGTAGFGGISIDDSMNLVQTATSSLEVLLHVVPQPGARRLRLLSSMPAIESKQSSSSATHASWHTSIGWAFPLTFGVITAIY